MSDRRERYEVVPRSFVGQPAVIIGTGPSLEPSDVELCRARGLKLFAVNNAWEFWPHIHVTVNPEWWDVTMEEETDLWTQMKAMDCWCSDLDASDKWGLKHFGWSDDAERRGLSVNPHNVTLGHSSGFAALNIAYLMGCGPILLLGHDMRFPAAYNGLEKKPGGKRHYFGEYSKRLQRWPTVKVRKTGELDGLIGCYQAVADRRKLVDIINVTPGSALEMFPKQDLKEALDDLPH